MQSNQFVLGTLMKRELPTLTMCTAELVTGAGDTRGWCHDCHDHNDQGDIIVMMSVTEHNMKM